MNVGSIVSNGAKTVYVFGKSVSKTGGFERVYGIGINLNTGTVDDIEDFLLEQVDFSKLSSRQLTILSKAIRDRLTLSNRVISISGKARSGKDTLAKEIAQRFDDEVIVHALGDPIKDVAHIIYGDYEGKNRKSLIMIGQGLREEDPNIWIKTWLRIALNDINSFGFSGFIVPDVRQPNEFTFFKSLGALTVKIDVDEDSRLEVLRRSDGEDALDPKLLYDTTEIHVPTFDTDLTVYNDYTKSFEEEVQKVIEKIKDKEI